MKTQQQFARYAVVGLVSNALIYLVYILLTRFGVSPVLAMSVLYLAGVLQTFVFNRNWSFGFAGKPTPALVRYVMLYAAGYAINVLALRFFVGRLGLPHEGVMAGLVVFMALLFFAGQKLWVFRSPTVAAACPPP